MQAATAVRQWNSQYAQADEVCVALSGGPDSTALTAAAVHAGLSVRALIVDHQLQDESAATAARAQAVATSLGAQASVLRVDVVDVGQGLEGAAREARYAALGAAREGRPVLVGHTLDDQAETVLLGLARGAGATSLAGMRPWRDPWGRPLLGVRREVTARVCDELGVDRFDDPHNHDRRFARVRVRRDVLPLLEEALPGAVVGLARTADQLADDVDHFVDALANYVPAQQLPVSLAIGVDAAIRSRMIARWLAHVGAREVTSTLVHDVAHLLSGASGEVAIGGDPGVRLVVIRDGDHLVAVPQSRT